MLNVRILALLFAALIQLWPSFHLMHFFSLSLSIRVSQTLTHPFALFLPNGSYSVRVFTCLRICVCARARVYACNVYFKVSRALITEWSTVRPNAYLYLSPPWMWRLFLLLLVRLLYILSIFVIILFSYFNRGARRNTNNWYSWCLECCKQSRVHSQSDVRCDLKKSINKHKYEYENEYIQTQTTLKSIDQSNDCLFARFS